MKKLLLYAMKLPIYALSLVLLLLAGCSGAAKSPSWIISKAKLPPTFLIKPAKVKASISAAYLPVYESTDKLTTPIKILNKGAPIEIRSSYESLEKSSLIWVKIQSGTVTGYAKRSLLQIYVVSSEPLDPREIPSVHG